MGSKSKKRNRGQFNNGRAQYRRMIQAKRRKAEQEALEIEQQAYEKRFRLEQQDAADELRRSILGPVKGL